MFLLPRLRRLHNSFEMYSVLLCVLATSPFVLFAALFRNISWIFHPLLFAGGWLLWTWVEYHVHRFLMHPKSEHHKTGTSRSHLHHHKQPRELEVNLFYRILLFIFNGAMVMMACRLNDYFTFFAGFSWGSAAFCYIHYLLHCKWTRRIMPRHHRFHIYHHCKYTNKCFGVSVAWWDRLFGTVPETNKEIPGRIVAFYYEGRKQPGDIHEKQIG
jgi:sterol desaturase/sphingolipid hydroxylase (fatty acid hydroxylase superfamily)